MLVFVHVRVLRKRPSDDADNDGSTDGSTDGSYVSNGSTMTVKKVVAFDRRNDSDGDKVPETKK